MIFRCAITLSWILFTTGAWAADHKIAFYAGGGLTSPGTLTYEADVDLDDDLLDGSDTFGALFGMRYTQWIGNDGLGWNSAAIIRQGRTRPQLIRWHRQTIAL